MKDSFILYTENKKQIDLLTQEQKGDLLDAIFSYAEGNTPEEMDAVTQMAFSFIQARMDRDAARYEEICEKRREAAVIAGKASASKRKQKQPKSTKSNQKVTNGSKCNQVQHDNDNDPDSDPDTLKSESVIRTRGELGNVKLTDNEIEKLKTDYGEEKTESAIDYLDKYIADKGYKTKSKTHLLAIQRWVLDALDEKAARTKPRDPPRKEYHNRYNDFPQRKLDYAKIEEEWMRSQFGK